MWMISFHCLSEKFLSSDVFCFSLSRRWKTEQQKASLLITQARKLARFPGVDKEERIPWWWISVFFFKCHFYRDYRPVLWAGRTLVFIIKWPKNTEAAAPVPVPVLDDGHDCTRPCRLESFLKGFDAFFRGSVTRLPEKTTTTHSSASSSALLWNLGSSVDNSSSLLVLGEPAWIWSQCSQKYKMKRKCCLF